MYLGHFIAWLSASILYAQQLQAMPGTRPFCQAARLQLGRHRRRPVRHRCRLDDGEPNNLPRGAGVPGRRPSFSRYRVTLFTGAVATWRVCSRDRHEVARLRGALRARADAMGAVVFVDFWLAERLGFRRFYAERSGVSINWAAAVAWIATLAVCLAS